MNIFKNFLVEGTEIIFDEKCHNDGIIKRSCVIFPDQKTKEREQILLDEIRAINGVEDPRWEKNILTFNIIDFYDPEEIKKLIKVAIDKVTNRYEYGPKVYGITEKEISRSDDRVYIMNYGCNISFRVHWGYRSLSKKKAEMLWSTVQIATSLREMVCELIAIEEVREVFCDYKNIVIHGRPNARIDWEKIREIILKGVAEFRNIPQKDLRFQPIQKK